MLGCLARRGWRLPIHPIEATFPFDCRLDSGLVRRFSRCRLDSGLVRHFGADRTSAVSKLSYFSTTQRTLSKAADY